MLVALDQFVGVWAFGWTYVWLGGERPCPSADETISSRVGKGAVAGHRWALIAEKIINWLARRCGDPGDHCRRNIESDEG